MNTLSINYDLNSPGQDYSRLHNAIQNLSGLWAKPTESFWLVKTRLSPEQVRDKLKIHLDKNDILIVSEFGSWASYNLPNTIIAWLNNKTFA